MKTEGGLPTGQGGCRRRVYTRKRIFRIQNKKGNSLSLGAFCFSSRTKGGQQQFHTGASRGYLMTRSARASTVGGIVRPICLAVFRLITNSNFVGCSTGRSPGFAPFNILST